MIQLIISLTVQLVFAFVLQHVIEPNFFSSGYVRFHGFRQTFYSSYRSWNSITQDDQAYYHGPWWWRIFKFYGKWIWPSGYVHLACFLSFFLKRIKCDLFWNAYRSHRIWWLWGKNHFVPFCFVQSGLIFQGRGTISVMINAGVFSTL